MAIPDPAHAILEEHPMSRCIRAHMNIVAGFKLHPCESQDARELGLPCSMTDGSMLALFPKRDLNRGRLS
jgi:hypothetical protein